MDPEVNKRNEEERAMRNVWVKLVLGVLVVAMAVPAAAIEVKYGGLYYMRFQSNNNVTDGTDDLDDNQNYFDQRMRWYMNFIASENLQLVTGFEVDTLWGDSRGSSYKGQTANAISGPKVLTGHRDTVGIEVKHAYLDFKIPAGQVPLQAKVGLQPLAFMTGWVVDEDFTAATFETAYEPVKISLGYIAEVNNDVTSSSENVDDWFLALEYAEGPIKASLLGFFQDGHNQRDALSNPVNGPIAPFFVDPANSYTLFDLGLNLGYKQEAFDVTLNYVQNLGSYDDPTTGDSVDLTGFMVEAFGNVYVSDLTFTLGGFVTSGDTTDRRTGALDTGGSNSMFQYPVGGSHYWAEIMGLGTLDTTINSSGSAFAGDQILLKGNYTAADYPSNLWTVNAGASYQVLEETKLTANYYYIGTYKEVAAGGLRANKKLKMASDIGHEIDLYVDQRIVDALHLRLVGAYLFAGDAYSISVDDDDAYELGAVLQWSF
jgi:hypothetical protein